MEWQPIETAPKDGTPILACGFICGQYHVFHMSFFKAFGWRDPIRIYQVGCDPIAWMPLPSAPAVTNGDSND